MGCDEHLYIEAKNVDGTWSPVDPPASPPDDFDGWGWNVKYTEDGEPHSWNFNRSYLDYAYLAGVRNRAGVTPLSTPRGLPDDVSPGVRVAREMWGYDGHSASWLTTTEMAAAPEEAFRIHELVEQMKIVAAARGLAEDDVRAVFWFDN